MQQPSLYQQNRGQMLLMGATIFASITAAVIVSTIIIMTLMRGEIASALSSNIQNSSPTSQVAGTCTAPAEEAAPAATTASTEGPVTQTAAVQFAPIWPANNSFNSSNVNTTNTTNNVTNTEVHNKTFIKDSFNDNSKHYKHIDNSKTVNVKIKDSFNPVIIKDNEVNVNSNNNTAVNSGNTANTTNTTNTVVNSVSNVNSNNVTNVASNNTTNSNNTVENHLLSDNNVVAVLP